MNHPGVASPTMAYEALRTDPRAALVDVRTPPELAYVGMPSLEGLGKPVATIPWFPEMTESTLVAQLLAVGIERADPVYFICRSGARSLNAAVLAGHGGFTTTFNVSGGFEGPLDAAGHRGAVAGWKVEGLPWRQS